MLTNSFYAYKYSGAQLLFHQQDYVQPRQNTQLEFMLNFYMHDSQSDQRKSTGAKAVFRMLMKLTPDGTALVSMLTWQTWN
jgi:hypothetical protein